MRLDSVFAPQFAPDVPIPAHILPTFEHLEQQALTALTVELSGTLQRIIQQSDQLIARQNINAILELNQGLGIALQRPLMSLWEQSWRSGSEHAIAEMQAAIPPSLRLEVESFKLSESFAPRVRIAKLLRDLLQFTPQTFRNLPAERAVQKRVLKLAGGFAKDTLDAVKAHLLSAVQPQPETGNSISRDELLKRLQGTLNVSRTRAQIIARTEVGAAYNRGRVNTYDDSVLCTHLLFMAIHDHRTTDICQSRDQVWILKSDRVAVKHNTPPLHYQCRSVLSPLLGAINPAHQRIIEDVSRDYRRRKLVPLPKGWRS